MNIQAPQISLQTSLLDKSRCLFLAGSITGVEDWQDAIVETPTFRKVDQNGRTNFLTISDYFHTFNPRRANYDKLISGIEEEQITWEYHHINNMCENILFWFGKETVAPITLYEYGRALLTHNHSKIWVGMHPEYPRKNDVLIQTRLVNPDLEKRIVYSLNNLARSVVKSAIHTLTPLD
jgi:hypothetical protein